MRKCELSKNDHNHRKYIQCIFYKYIKNINYGHAYGQRFHQNSLINNFVSGMERRDSISVW